jgi:hypothetical protein
LEELAVFAEIEYTQPLGVATAYAPGVWRYCLYATGEILPFMVDTFNRIPVKVNNVVIDGIEAMLCASIKELMELPADQCGWVNGGSIIYVRCKEYLPPSLSYSKRYGTVMGFTNGSPVLHDGTMYRSGLLTAPVVEQSADTFTYDKMKFNSATVSIDNTNGQFDDIGKLFGNEFNLKVGVLADKEETIQDNLVRMIGDAPESRVISLSPKNNDEFVVLGMAKKNAEKFSKLTQVAQYYIANIIVTLAKADFTLKDKRERLSFMIPDKKFTADTLADIAKGADIELNIAHLDDNLIDKDMQEAYGHCFGVPGVCLNGKRIFIDKNNAGMDNTQGDWNNYYFRFSSAIKEVDRIQVKFTSGEINGVPVDGWTTVYENNTWKKGITGCRIDYEHGLVLLPFSVAKQGGRRENKPNDVRMDGVFINMTKPLDILKDIMEKYAWAPYDIGNNYFIPENTTKKEIESELAPLSQEIGVLFDKSITVYEAIEKLQGGCVKGFQFHIHEDKFTARLDDPKRKTGDAIHFLEIKNLDEVEIDWNAELYGSYTDIEYAYNYSEKSGRHWVDKTKQIDILDNHRAEKEFAVTSLLANEKDAKQRSDMLLEDFLELRPIIRNIKLEGEKWHGLRVYDMRDIDFSIPGTPTEKYPARFIKLIDNVKESRIVSVFGAADGEHVILADNAKEHSGERKFAGKLRCQIQRVELDTGTGVTTIDARVMGKVIT